MRSAAWVLGIAVVAGASAAAAPVEFVVNDALLKDEPLGGVSIRVAATADPGAAALVQGETDERGSFKAELQPGTYYVSYSKPGFVRIQRTPTEVSGVEGQTIVTSLAMSLEAEGLEAGTRRLKLVLNWGSDPDAHASDLDSHLYHVESGAQVYFAQRAAGPLQLDVDDIDWGGPETITLTSPPPGTYYYWVHDYSGSPAIQASQAVVRVISGDTLQAEYRPQGTVDPQLTAWRPFAALHVTEDSITIADWPVDELAANPGLAYELPPGGEQDTVAHDNFEGTEPVELGSVCCVMVGMLLAMAMVGLGLRGMFKS
ncbi:MAG: hypothetical protein KDD82_29285 [Planctomycetes bacterium]|nr:hypothetical protein [Planctomycetota bacterium]